MMNVFFFCSHILPLISGPAPTSEGQPGPGAGTAPPSCVEAAVGGARDSWQSRAWRRAPTLALAGGRAPGSLPISACDSR